MWVVYVLRCADGSLYTGVTTNVSRRVHEHNTSKRGSRYTRSRRPVRILAVFVCSDKSSALREERRIKTLTKQKKEALVDMANIFSLKREALREIVGATNTLLEEGAAVKGAFLTDGHDTAIIELSCGSNLILSLGVIAKDHADAIRREQEDFHARVTNKLHKET